MKIEELIGKRFRRNKYGLSIWWDTISSVSVSHELVSLKDGTFKPKIWVKGSLHSLPIEEVVIVPDGDTR